MSSEFNTSRPITDDLEANPIILTATSDSSELTLLRVTYLERGGEKKEERRKERGEEKRGGALKKVKL